MMKESIKVYAQNSIHLNGVLQIYIDPFHVPTATHNADFVFITHPHWDHFSLVDVLKVKKEDTIFVIPKELYEELLDIGVAEDFILVVKPFENYHFEHISFETIPAYNLKSDDHPKNKNWVGYLIEMEKVRYYVAGDTDVTPESKNVQADVLFLPVGGTYTMDYKEASILANILQPHLAIPTHYASVVGTNQDAKRFCHLVDKKIATKVLYQEKREEND